MKKRIIIFLGVSLFVLGGLTGCGTNQETSKETIQPDSPPTVNQYEIISEPLEEARLFYVAALQKQALNSVSEALKNYESALERINGLSNFPGIDENEAFNELSSSIKEDYKKYIESLPELPDDVSFAARDAWLKKTLVELNLKQDVKNLLIRKETIQAEIPLEINGAVENWVEYYTGKGRKDFTTWLSRSGRYFPAIRRILKEEGLPEQLAYLTLVESGLDPTAKSWSGGEGCWAIQKSVASLFGLQSNFYVDERRDPEKSTRMAAKYIKSLYTAYNDWYLVIAAFNTGEGRVSRILKKTSATNYWDLMPHLPKETQNYVPQFIAISSIGLDPSKYGFGTIAYQNPAEFETVAISEAIDLGFFADVAGLNPDDLRALNPELLQSCTPVSSSTPYLLKVPVGSSSRISQALLNVPSGAKRNFAYHTVKRGESIKSIASKYRVSAEDLADVNNISTRAKLKGGIKLRIPFSSSYQLSDYGNISNEAMAESTTTAEYMASDAQMTEPESAETAVSQPAGESDEFDPSVYDASTIAPVNRSKISYTVKQGESILDIASMFNVRVSDLRNWNNISYTKTIRVGQVISLFVPDEKKEYYASLENLSNTEKKTVAAAEPAVSRKITRYHKVRRGETLRSIALQYSVSGREIAEWNGLRNGKLRKNQRLIIYQMRESDFVEAARVEKRSTTTSVFRHKVKRGETLSDIARRYGVSSSAIKRINHLKGNRLIAGTNLKIRATERTTSYGDNVSRNASSAAYHIVRKGEAISGVAKKYGVSVKDLRRWNGLTGNTIQAGKKLRVSSGAASNAVMPKKRALNEDIERGTGKSSVKNKNSTAGAHTVQRGESLSSIAKKHGTTVRALSKANNLSSEKLKPGQKLIVR